MKILENNTSIIFQGDSFCFVVGKDGRAKSLKIPFQTDVISKQICLVKK